MMWIGFILVFVFPSIKKTYVVIDIALTYTKCYPHVCNDAIDAADSLVCNLFSVINISAVQKILWSAKGRTHNTRNLLIRSKLIVEDRRPI